MSDLAPAEQLVRRFWEVTKDDLAGRGVTFDSLPYRLRRLPYSERVIIERKQVQDAATKFIESDNFSFWAELSGLNPDYLREKLCQG